MNSRKTRFHFLHEPKDLGAIANTGVSMHCHTLHSKEILDFIPYYATRIPVLSYFWQRECRRYVEREKTPLPDFTNGYWLPPLSGDEVYQSEKDQLNSTGLDAVVSITDHDGINANLDFNRENPDNPIPISMEWTVPFKDAFLHLGIHNLPPARAAEITTQLLAYTANTMNPDNERLHQIFALLNELPEVLIVLNHPLWDIEMSGDEAHRKLLKDFLAEHGVWLHAFEVNGFRSWSENKAVIEMAETLGYPLVTGGDRHCSQANTVINLTDSKTFAEFAEEIRVDKHSQIVLMPEYREPLPLRQVNSIAHIMKNYPEFPESRRRWFDRVYIDINDNSGLQPLSFHWQERQPQWLGWLMLAIGITSHKTMRPFFRLAMKREDYLPKQTTFFKHIPLVGNEPLATDSL